MRDSWSLTARQEELVRAVAPTELARHSRFAGHFFMRFAMIDRILS